MPGKIKIFLGYAPGVGKAKVMVEEARRRKQRGEDCVMATGTSSYRARYEVARAFLRHAVMHLPDSAEAHRYYGASLFRTQREKGLFHLRAAVRLAPDDAEGCLALGHSLVEVDRAEALKTLLRAVELDPDGNSGRKARNVIASCQLDEE